MDMMTPYIATTSQKMIDIKFLVLIRGALTPPPRIEEPVMKIPLFEYFQHSLDRRHVFLCIPCCPNN